MKKSEKNKINNQRKEKSIPKPVKEQLKPLVQDLLQRCSRVKTLTRKLEWEELQDIFAILEKIMQLEKRYVVPFRDRQQHWDEFYKWCSQNKAHFDSLKIKQIDEQNFGVAVEKEIKESDLILRVPCCMMMTEVTAQESKLGPLIAEDPILGQMANVKMALHLLYEFLDTNSFWRPYISILPHEYTTILYFSWEELQELQGSPVLDEVFKVYRSVARQYAYFFQLFQHNPYAKSLNVGPFFTFELYRWCVSTVMSRQNHIPGKDCNSTITALIPLFDMCNHANGKLSTDFLSDALVSYAMKPYAKGEELHMFYGQRTNGEFFVHNGFVYPENEEDAVLLKLGISPSDPLFSQKKQLCAQIGCTTSESFKLKKGRDIPELLFKFAKICILNEDEADEDKRALLFLRDRLHLLLRAYKTTLEEDETLAITESRHRWLALQLRMTEKRILTQAYNYCLDQTT